MHLCIRVNTIRRTWACRSIDHAYTTGINKITNPNIKVLTSISRRIACKANQLISEKVTMQSPLATHRRAGHDATIRLQNFDSNLGVIPHSHEHLPAVVDSKSVGRRQRRLRLARERTNRQSRSDPRTPLHKKLSSSSPFSPDVHWLW
jgi:hypothetical protein